MVAQVLITSQRRESGLGPVGDRERRVRQLGPLYRLCFVIRYSRAAGTLAPRTVLLRGNRAIHLVDEEMEDAMTITWRRRVILTGLLTLLLGLGLTDLAAADGGGGGGGDPQTTRPTPEDPDYSAAVRAIKAERFADAIPLLEKVVAKEPRNADAYNWLGYATRRKGDPAASIPIYEKALAIDPKHLGAHEYIGEAYLMLRDLPKAKEHLATLDKLCFFSCEEYRDLKKAVERFEKTGKVSTTH